MSYFFSFKALSIRRKSWIFGTSLIRGRLVAVLFASEVGGILSRDFRCYCGGESFKLVKLRLCQGGAHGYIIAKVLVIF